MSWVRCLSSPCRRSAFQYSFSPPASLRLGTACFSSDAEDEAAEAAPPPPDRWHEPVAMVTGASRGLGLEFTRQLLTKYPGVVVYGTARNPDASPGLQALKRRHPVRLELGTLDVTKEDTMVDLKQQMADKYGRLDLIVNCAGVLRVPDFLEPEALVSKVEPEKLLLAYDVNAVGPVIVAKHFWELLKKGQGHGTGRAAAVIANISARASSMKENTFAGLYGFRASKAALNMMTKSISIESSRKKEPVLIMLLHPGTVNTEATKPYTANVPHMKLFSTDYAVERLLGIINKVRHEDNGKFTSWDRQEVSW